MKLLRGLVLVSATLLLVGSAHRPVPSGAIPAVPSSRADRLGVYNWNIDDRAFTNGSTDRLNWGADRVAAAGSRTLRIYLGPRDVYHLRSSATNLAELAASIAYDRLFRDPRFSTYLLTTYSYSSLNNTWSDGFVEAEYRKERDEIQALGEYLLAKTEFSGKTFIILNWEGDNELEGLTDKQSAWDSYRAVVEARAEGVRRARAASSQNTKVFSALEFNLVRSRITNQPCGTPVDDPVNRDPLINRCVIDYVAPSASVDYFSYSAWQSLGTILANPTADLAAEIKADVRAALTLVRTGRPEVTEANFIIGEFGFERAAFGECRAAELVGEFVRALEGGFGLGVSHAIFWQIVDSATLFSVVDNRYGLLRTDERGDPPSLVWTLAGHAFRKSIAGELPDVTLGCPGIKRPPPDWGVVDAETGLPVFHLEPDSILSIRSDAPFSPSGNTVRFAQSGLKTTMTVANGAILDESDSTITARLPSARRPGIARVLVSNSDSVDSNGQVIYLWCPDCPSISGIVESRYQTSSFEPGRLISIRGSFSETGNNVQVEQRIEGELSVRTLLAHDSNWAESRSEIRAALPSILVRDTDASITVIDQEGRSSGDYPIFIDAPCADCTPKLSSGLSGLLDQGPLYAGSIVYLPGYYPRTGNRVVVEQYAHDGVMHRHTLTDGVRGWSESDHLITVGLPRQIQPGRALLYVVDSLERESQAVSFTVAPSTLSVVSAASFRPLSSTPGGIMAAFGQGLAIATVAAGTIPLPTELGGTTVLIEDSEANEHQASMFFVSPQQVNFQIPPTVSLGPALIVLQAGNGSLSTLATSIGSVEPGVFSANADGEGAPAGTFIHISAEGEQREEHTAEIDLDSGRFVPTKVSFGPQPGQLFLVLYGTGIRLVTSPNSVRLFVGGLPADVTYAGPQGGLVGLDQVNVRLPRSLIGGGLMNVELVVDERPANVLQVWIN